MERRQLLSTTAFSRTTPERYVFLSGVQRVPYGTQYLNEAQIADFYMGAFSAAIFENDGVIVPGQNVLDAFDRLEVLESTAEAVINARSLGEISSMPDSVIDELKFAFQLE